MTKEQEHTAREYREALTALALELKEARARASGPMALLGAEIVSEGRGSEDFWEEQLVRLACTWGDVTYQELNRFYLEATNP